MGWPPPNPKEDLPEFNGHLAVLSRETLTFGLFLQAVDCLLDASVPSASLLGRAMLSPP
jgi:hypothetical protein